jgi:hypothetical protein
MSLTGQLENQERDALITLRNLRKESYEDRRWMEEL